MATQHVTKKGDKWQVKGAGNDKATKLFDTQKEALEYAKTIAGNKDATVMIHGKDGKIRGSAGGEKKAKVITAKSLKKKEKTVKKPVKAAKPAKKAAAKKPAAKAKKK